MVLQSRHCIPHPRGQSITLSRGRWVLVMSGRSLRHHDLRREVAQPLRQLRGEVAPPQVTVGAWMDARNHKECALPSFLPKGEDADGD